MSDMNQFDPNAGSNNEFNQQSQQPNNYGQPQQFDYSQQSFGYTGAPVQQEQKGKSIAALVLGLCSFIAWIIPLFGYPVSIVGIVMGAQGMKKGGKGMAIAGIICAVIGLILTLLNSILGAMLSLAAF